MRAFDAHRDGFHMSFPNGYTVSVMWGQGNYADAGKTTAELAVWDVTQDGEPFVRVPGVTDPYDQVSPRLSAAQVALALHLVAIAAPGAFKRATL
jgi:hypothetical protein